MGDGDLNRARGTSDVHRKPPRGGFRLSARGGAALPVLAPLLLALTAWAAPPACAWLDGALAGDTVRLIWMPAPDAVRYAVYRDGALVGGTGDYEWSSPAPEKPGSYRFEVAPLDASGAEGPRSPPALVQVAAFPSAPSHLKLRPEVFGPKVRLRWGAVRGAASYDLYRGVGVGGPLVLQCNLAACETVDEGVKHGHKYRYVISAVDGEGREGERSEPVFITVPVPGPC